ncbi:MAG TPA: BatA and WFA domain-containing protein [Pirellulales bacterium]|nr:BatA and WFA domain-containing protein [Pirellulales bacterium]
MLQSMLSPLQWVVLAAVPPAIVALYFLKLKRQPLEVPSTYLWHKSIEDLHVNSIWQRLRQSLLLLLQLLLIALLMLTLMKPSWQSSRLVGGHYIFLIDNSASMGATDVEPTRLDAAKKRALALIDEMKSGDAAMVISFADSARVEQSYTDNRNELRRHVEAIKLTDRATSLADALRVASGLANPGRTSNVEDSQDFQVAHALEAKLYIFSDGKFPDVKDFALGNLEPIYEPIGTETAKNIAIAAFTTARHEVNADQFQAFGRIENFGLESVEVEVELRVDNELVDAQRVSVEPGQSEGLAFPLEGVQSGVLQLKAGVDDHLAVDNTAWTTLNPPQPMKVLVLTPGNRALAFALATEKVRALAEVVEHSPDYLKQPEYQKQAASAGFDLIIYDRCQPEAMPQADTMFIDRLPVGEAWKAGEVATAPQIIDTDRAHPLMQIVEMGDVVVAEAQPLHPPVGSTVLIDTNAGPICAIGPREGYEDLVLGFAVFDPEHMETNWFLRPSFPVFVLNLLEYLGSTRAMLLSGSVLPGQTVTWRSDTAGETIQVTLPDKSSLDVARGKLNAFHFSATSSTGVYEVREKGKATGNFAVNLFNPLESNLPPRQELKIGDTQVAGKALREPVRYDAWKLILWTALAILLLEWYIYNRRVYV